MKRDYVPHGVCARRIVFELDGDTVRGVAFIGGCDGNQQGIAHLIEGMKAVDVIGRLEGITCDGKPTSCPAQLAEALKEALSAGEQVRAHAGQRA